MIKEVTNSIKAALYQRVSSPLYGTYFISWLIYNWEITLPFIFGSETFDDRLVDFKSGLIYQNGGLAWDTVLAPLLIAAAILGLQPIIQRFLFIYTEWNKSEGLKKRDQFNSETMLTLDQSNELRASIRKIQQFNQEVLKNKDDEIAEYKRQLDTKQASINDQDERIIELTEDFMRTESKSTELSAELTKSQGQVDNLKIKYKRLSGILSKQRIRTRKLRKTYKSPDFHASDDFLRELTSIILINELTYNAKQHKEYVSHILSFSSTPQWANACHKLIIDGFASSWSYNMADNYFDELIKPYANYFNENNLQHLTGVMSMYGQISGRRRAKADSDFIEAVIKSKQSAES